MEKEELFYERKALTTTLSSLFFLKLYHPCAILAQISKFSKPLNEHSTLIPPCNFTECSSPIFGSVLNARGLWKQVFLLVFIPCPVIPISECLSILQSPNTQERGWRISSPRYHLSQTKMWCRPAPGLVGLEMGGMGCKSLQMVGNTQNWWSLRSQTSSKEIG